MIARSEFLAEAFERIRDAFYPTVMGLSEDELRFRPEQDSNPIAWLAWHLTRVQDETVARVGRLEAVWTSRGWLERFAISLQPTDTGFGHSPRDVARVVAPADLLLDYFEDVHQQTVAFIRSLDDEALSRRADGKPPRTVEERLLDVLVDDLQHVGQAAYVRGIVQRLSEDVDVIIDG
jgi:hypothetical protein